MCKFLCINCTVKIKVTISTVQIVFSSFSNTMHEPAGDACNVFAAAELASRTVYLVNWRSFQGSSQQLHLQVAWFRACWRKEMWSSWQRMSSVRHAASSARRSTAWKLRSSWRTSSKRRWTSSSWRRLIYELNRTSFTGGLSLGLSNSETVQYQQLMLNCTSLVKFDCFIISLQQQLLPLFDVSLSGQFFAVSVD